MTTGLYWFQHDLRLAGKRTFNQLCAQVDVLICVYINGHNQAQQSGLLQGNTGQHKSVFEQQSVVALDASLRLRNQYLLCLDTY